MTGTCAGCKMQRDLDDGRHVAQHRRFANSSIDCHGSGKLSVEASAENAETRRRRALARLDRVREEAQVAHDAVSERRPYPAFRLQQLLKAALLDYRVRFPGSKDRRAWFVHPPGHRRHGGRKRDRVDVYCTFCRELILGRWVRGGDATHATATHTTICALRVLAKISEPVAPTERRLPAEARPEPVF